jgi:Leucine-rich repeat (LRR) protein
MDNIIENGLEMIYDQYKSLEGEDTGLRVLKLGNNRIKDFAEVEKLKGLTNLMQLDLTKNPINESV